MTTARHAGTEHHRLLTLWYFVRRYRVDLVALLGAVVGYVFAAGLVTSPRLLFGLSVAITVIATSVIVALEARGRDFIWLTMRSEGDRNGWIGQGGLAYARIEDAYRITGAYDGAILSETLTWSDYRLRFGFRIETVSVGVILRAANLGNLVMLQVLIDRVKAHIRVHGAWLVWDRVSSLTFPAPLALGTWYGCEIVCDKRNVRLIVCGPDGGEYTLTWTIPAGNVEFGSSGPQTVGILPVPFMVNYDYGAVGLRNDIGESALVRNVFVEQL